jgi:replication initiation and membrane attachment protein DnaB
VAHEPRPIIIIFIFLEVNNKFFAASHLKKIAGDVLSIVIDSNHHMWLENQATNL